jgi:hypothetical protein
VRLQPAIGDYALIGDCHAAALVSSEGSIDWCCMPAFDEGSVFGRLLDADAGGCCSIGGGGDVRRVGYLEGTLVLETQIRSKDAEARVVDCFLIDENAERHARKLTRIVEGVRGVMPVTLSVAPRFDYAESRPWLRPEGPGTFSAIAGNDALVVRSDRRLERVPHDAVELDATVEVGERVRLLMTWALPEELDDEPPGPLDPERLDAALDATVECGGAGPTACACRTCEHESCCAPRSRSRRSPTGRRGQSPPP